MKTFVAIDFETADPGADSACAVGLVRVAGGEIVARVSKLIRPPRRLIQYTRIHGITWAMVEREPCFAELWPTLADVLAGAGSFVAHNAPFDRGVLTACCRAAGIAPPPLPFLCTVQLARRTWGVRPTKLPDVCRYLGLELKHHDALSDAEAAARIVLAAQAHYARPA